jgi:chromosome segregation ATPase
MNVQYRFVQRDASCSGGKDKADEGETGVEVSVETELDQDAVSPFHKELRRVPGCVRRIRTERLFSKEWQEAARHGGNTQSVNEAQIRPDEESFMCQVGASRELSPTGRCVRAEPTAITRGRHTLKRQEILDQFTDAAALRQQLVNVMKERDALMLEAERNAAIAEGVQKQRDALNLQLENVRAENEAQKRELENLRAQYQEDVAQLKDEVRIVRTQCDQFICERRVLITRAQLIDEDLEAVKEVRDSLKRELESLRAQHQEDVAQLKDEVRIVRTQCDQFICERRVLITRAQLIDEDLEAVKEVRDSLKRELESLRAQYQEDVAQLEEQLLNVKTQSIQLVCAERLFMLKALRTDEAFEALKRETENHDGQCKDSVQLEKQLKDVRAELNKITKDRNSYILKVQRLAENRAKIKEERDALRREAGNWRCQCKDAAVLEKQLNAATATCERRQKQSRLQARLAEANMDAMKRETDDLKRELEKLRHQCNGIGMLQVNLNIVRADHNKIRRERDAMKKDMDALRLENQNLRSQTKNAAVLEEQLNIVRAKCDDMKRLREAFVLVGERRAGNKRRP